MIRVQLYLLAPLSHGAFDVGDIGNASAIRRMPVVSIAGRPEIPALSGNSLRGRLRRVVMPDLFDRVGLSRADLPAPAWDRLYAALANGGHLDGSEASVSPDAIRELRAALPPLSMLGSALYSWMLPGRCSVGFCWPVCVETVAARLVDAIEGPLFCAEDLVAETSHCRHIDRTEHDPEVSGVTPMPTTIETLATGTRLEARIHVYSEATAIERAAIAYGLDRIHEIGGKVAGGLGWAEITHDGDAGPYEEWLGTSLVPARAALVKLAADLTRHKAKPPKKGKAIAGAA